MSDSIKNIMSGDHKFCDNLLVQLDELVMKKDWSIALKQMTLVIDNILYHFKHEEDILFPWFESATGNTHGPTMVMRNEHEQIRELLIDLELSIKDQNDQRYFGLSESLNIFVQQHNIKEEGILYPMIEELSNNNDNEPLIMNMINHQHNRAA